MIDIQYSITIMGGREVSRPYRVLFFAEGERFLSFWRCHRPRWRGRWQKAVFYVFVSVPQYFSTEPKAADNHHDYRLPIVPPQGIEP